MTKIKKIVLVTGGVIVGASLIKKFFNKNKKAPEKAEPKKREYITINVGPVSTVEPKANPEVVTEFYDTGVIFKTKGSAQGVLDDMINDATDNECHIVPVPRFFSLAKATPGEDVTDDILNKYWTLDDLNHATIEQIASKKWKIRIPEPNNR